MNAHTFDFDLQADELLAYQVAFDLVENEMTSFLTKVGSSMLLDCMNVCHLKF